MFTLTLKENVISLYGDLNLFGQAFNHRMNLPFTQYTSQRKK